MISALPAPPKFSFAHAADWRPVAPEVLAKLAGHHIARADMGEPVRSAGATLASILPEEPPRACA